MYKLLIVEDEPLIRAGLTKYFDWEELGVTTITEADNGISGLETALQTHPDLIITDIRMPEMNGLEMIRQLKERIPECAYIILSGYEDFSYAQQALRLGVQDYLLKPLQYEESMETIRQCLQHVAQKYASSASQQELEPETLEEASASSDSLEDRIFSQIEAYIIENINQEISLQAVAEKFFYNPAYLSRLFKMKLSKNYMTYVTEIRINQAKSYLRESRHSITEVGEKCGYRSYKHFVKLFKKVAGVTPTEYRKDQGCL